MRYFLGIIGLIASFFIIYKREKLGDTFGEAEWMQKVGGVYNLMIIVGVIIFFWSIAGLTGTEDILFYPLYAILPGSKKGPPVNGF